MQLDIFAHSRDVVLRNDVSEALKSRDYATSAQAIATLATEFGRDPLLPAFAILHEALCLPPPPSLGQEAATAALDMIERVVVPAAWQAFGENATALLAPLWCDLAIAVADRPYVRKREATHAASLWLRAGNWTQAIASIAGIPSWRRQPAPLAWMVEARYQLDGFAATWPLLAELCWMAPGRAEKLLPRLTAPETIRLLRRFHAEFEGNGKGSGDNADLAWLPAWAAIAEPHMAAGLTETQAGNDTPPERCARLILNLLVCERQGKHHELVDGRKKLRAAHPGIFANYMASR